MFSAKIIAPELYLFLIAGGTAAAVNLGTRFIFSFYLSYVTAVCLAYLVGMVTAFLLMRFHVFNATNGSVVSQIIKFVLINIFAGMQTIAISLFLADWLLPKIGIKNHVNAEAIAHFTGVLVPVITSFFGHKLITFRSIPKK